MKNGGGHFAPELGGHFELELGAHFKLELGGQYHWNLHFIKVLWVYNQPDYLIPILNGKKIKNLKQH